MPTVQPGSARPSTVIARTPQGDPVAISIEGQPDRPGRAPREHRELRRRPRPDRRPRSRRRPRALAGPGRPPELPFPRGLRRARPGHPPEDSARRLGPGPRLGPEPLPGPAVSDAGGARRRGPEHARLRSPRGRTRRHGRTPRRCVGPRSPGTRRTHPGDAFSATRRESRPASSSTTPRSWSSVRSRLPPSSRSSRPSSGRRTSSSRRGSPPSTRWASPRGSRTSTCAWRAPAS